MTGKVVLNAFYIDFKFYKLTNVARIVYYSKIENNIRFLVTRCRAGLFFERIVILN